MMFNDVYEITPDFAGNGGLAEMSTMIKEEKKKDPNSIAVFPGDFMSASQLAVKHKGGHAIDIFNEMPVDYICPGNHEFDFGAENLKEFIGKSKQKWLISNIFEKGTREVLKGCYEYDVIEHDEGRIKIGLFGVCTKDTINLSMPGDSVEFESVVENSRRMVKFLKHTKGCNVIIALTHLPIHHDRLLAKFVSNINLILGGHDHSPHTQVQNGCFIHKAGMNSQYLTVIDLHIEMSRVTVNDQEMETVQVFPSCNMKLNRYVIPDPPVKKIVDKYMSELPDSLNQIIGLLTTPLDSSTEKVRSKETSMGNLLADAVKFIFDTEFVLVNGGTLRGDRQMKAGHHLSIGDLKKEFPFPNPIKKASIKGKDLLEAIEHGLGRAELVVGSFPHFCKGTSIEYDISMKPGKRIVKAILNGKPLDPEKEYVLGTTGYLLGGGDGYASLKRATHIKHKLDELPVSEIVQRYIEETNIIAAKKEGRCFLTAKNLQNQASF
eukprot:CAMPEP_0117423048 /NCGR_PEP_ID=MMETSP0758-20121206/3767_1 /TAXON_ID=63605 /ORGANISM="Percolomonas cosmopolitus, Strain AE-1 (ATCC 50343)" /LENGTH=491 /DNA_ID=CAMNT_0005206037 /DNA_START=104 /DNA_END=1579 /DNA_ORIENTATION=-